MMDVCVQPDEAGYIISCPDQMEWHARVDLVEALKNASGGRPFCGVIVDLDKVTYVNSAGLGAIFALRKYARENGAGIVVARPSATIRRLLDTVNLGALIPIVETLSQARATIAERAAQSPSA